MQNYEYMIANGVAPETAIERAFGGGGTTINNNMGEGGIDYGQPPTNHAWARTPDGAIQTDERGAPIALPVGPALAEIAAQDDKTESRGGMADTASDAVVTAASRAREAANERIMTGALGGLAAYNPASQNAEVYRQVTSLRAMAAAENLNAMRQASPTGGAMGNASDADIKLLMDKAGALDPASPNFQRDLDDYERFLLRTIHGNEAGDRIYQETRSGDVPPPAPDAAAGGGAWSGPSAPDILMLSQQDLLALGSAINDQTPPEIVAAIRARAEQLRGEQNGNP
jgi:hypothetical protein